MANSEAVSRGYHQVLWLLNGTVTEAGASNFFVVWKTKEGKTELVTAPLGDKIILDGITRRSILQLVRERLADNKSGLEPVDVVERQFTMDDLAEAIAEGRLIEAFAAGTAVRTPRPVPAALNHLLTEYFSSSSFPPSPSSATKIKTCRSPWCAATAGTTPP
jgi:branched-subunit amino acid aminotransferase/4-amino-4-deoxychorismate lyase